MGNLSVSLREAVTKETSKKMQPIPMDEHAEFVILELLTSSEVLLSGFVNGLLGTDTQPCCCEQDCDCDGSHIVIVLIFS